jgi:hypothetical protein
MQITAFARWQAPHYAGKVYYIFAARVAFADRANLIG